MIARLWIKKAGLFFLGCYWLIGCAPVKKPVVTIPQQWNMGGVSLQSGENLPYTAWWNRFDDPMLNQLISIGLHENNTVQQARARLLTAKEELRAVQLSWIPSLKWYAGYSTNPQFGVPGGLYGAWPGYFAYNVFMTLARQKSARINIEAQHYALQSTKLVLIGQIARNYYIYIAEIERLRLFERYLDDLQELLQIEGDNYRGGIESLLPFASFKQIIAETRSTKQVIKDNIVKEQNALHYLLNQNPGTFSKTNAFSKIKTTYPTFATLPVTVLANRPDVAFAETQYRLAVQQVVVEKTTLLPAIQLDEFFGGAANGKTPMSQVSALFTDAYGVWSIDPAVFGEIGALKGIAKEAYFGYVDTVRKALQEVANDLSAHQTANARYQDIQRAYRAAKERYDLDMTLYKQGIQPYDLIVKDKIDLDKVALEVNAIKLVQMMSLVNLYQDLGGGYQWPSHHIVGKTGCKTAM